MGNTIPIIKIHDNLLVSIQVELSDHLVAELKENVTSEITRTAATGLIIEVSGVDILDSYIARSIRDLSHIARLMGARAVIAGLDPSMAVTLVEMGLQMTGVATALNLETSLQLLATESQAQLEEMEEIMADAMAGTDAEAEL
jgi:rsbT antagonist protein RsbS